VKKVLFISGSIGLGHVTRDLAIADELRRRNPGVEISWLASSPASDMIKGAGEMLLPEADQWADDNLPAENAALGKGFQLNLLKYLLLAREEWENNVKVFKQVTEKEPFDLIVGDETYEIAVALKKNPSLKKAFFVMIYDFVGMDSMTRNPKEKLGVYIWNRIWAKDYKKASRFVDASLFVGEKEDIPDNKLGFLLPNRRTWARYRDVKFTGYILPFNPADYADKDKIRAKLGYGEETLVVCSIGGTSVGKELLELCGGAFTNVRDKIPGLRMILVCGPRLSPQSLSVPTGVEVRGYVPNLYEHFAASDLAVIQAGGATTLELTALRRPFLYFPLESHFEQMKFIAARLARHQAGIKLFYSQTTPELLGEAIIANIGKKATWPPIDTDGVEKAARYINDFLS
jgi:predicted glycosyltransferase